MHRYSQEEKAEALALAAQIGAKKASEKLNISYGALLGWKKAAAANEEEPTIDPVEEAAEDTNTQAPTEVGIPLDEQVRALMKENAELIQESQRLRNAIMALITK